MGTKQASDVRRVRLVDAALELAGRVGIGSITMRGVAEEAGVSTGVVNYSFESKEALVTAMGESMIFRITDTLHRAYEGATLDRQLTGVRGLQELLHHGLSVVWPTMQSSADLQLLVLELKTFLVRHRAMGSTVAGHIASEQYRIEGQEFRQFLERCSEHTGTQWLEPLESITTFGIAFVDGLSMRWLVDRDDVAVLAQLDDLSRIIAAKAVEV